MVTESVSMAEAEAQRRSEETRAFVRQVKRVTRRKFSPEEKIRIVLEGFRGEVRVSELCRREGIRPNVYYAWLKDFMEAGKARLQADTVRDATQAQVGALKRENEGLKQLVAELSLQNLVLKKTAVPGFE
jgi:transposase